MPLPLVRDTAFQGPDQPNRQRITSVPFSNGRWSPDLRYLAFVAADAARVAPPRLHAWKTEIVENTEFGNSDSGRRNTGLSLFVYDANNGEVRQVTPPTMHVGGSRDAFDWSPDGRTLVVEVDSAARDAFGQLRTDIVLVDLVGGRSRALADSILGDKSGPRWSPDGRWIAFHLNTDSTRNRPPRSTHTSGQMALVRPDTGAVARVDGPGGFGINWLSNSTSFSYTAYDQMTMSLVWAEVATLRSSRSTFATGAGDVARATQSFSVDSVGRTVSYILETPTTPPTLQISRVSPDHMRFGNSREIIAAVEHNSLADRVVATQVNWPSRDGRFRIHGILYAPRAGAPAAAISTALPTILSIRGGPNRILAEYPENLFGLELALAARGYAVLVPYTRGRGPGFGDDFSNAIRDGRSRFALPYEDAMGGLDMLVRNGTADPARLGIFGHSYGGGLVAYTLTRTIRFRAAIIHEGAVFNVYDSRFIGVEPGSAMDSIFGEWFGITDPFDAAQRRSMLRESPLLNADQVRTPSLLIYGSESDLLPQQGVPFYHALRRFNVPSVLLIRRMSHAPAGRDQIRDTIAGASEWFDHWVREMPYPNADRGTQFESWRRSAGATPLSGSSQ